jgi:hypothetical protein
MSLEDGMGKGRGDGRYSLRQRRRERHTDAYECAQYGPVPISCSEGDLGIVSSLKLPIVRRLVE